MVFSRRLTDQVGRPNTRRLNAGQSRAGARSGPPGPSPLRPPLAPGDGVSDVPQKIVRRDGTTTESWGPAKTVRKPHEPDCTCQRCRGFQPGNGLSTTHGAYSVVQLAPRAREVADGITAAMIREDLWRDSFGSAVSACAVVLVRLERAEAALQHAEDLVATDGASPLAMYLGRDGRDPLGRLREDSRRWANAARGYLNDLGLTPTSLARIARDTGIGRATRASAAMQALGDHLEREHGERER